MRASPVSWLMRPVSIAYRFLRLRDVGRGRAREVRRVEHRVRGFARDAGRSSTVGTSVWFCSHTSACTIDPPNVTLCLPFSQVAVFSMTFVDASRD